MSENRLLVMDDDPDVAEFFGRVAEQLEFEVATVNEPEGFVAKVGEFQPGTILLDLQMPGRDGIELLRELADTGCRADIVIASGVDGRVIASAEK